MQNITEFKSYKAFLSTLFTANSQRGLQARLAKAAGCQPSYLSQICKGKAHLSADQAFAIAGYLDLSEVERDFFLLLVELAKAATTPLQRRLQEKLKILHQRNRESLRFFPRNTLDPSFASEFYSSWAYNAARIFLNKSFPRSEQELGRRFGLQPAYAKKILTGLERMGLAKKSGEGWISTNTPGPTLGGEDAMYVVSHMNYRIKAIEENLRGNPSFSFSCSTALTESGYKKVCEILERTVAEFSRVEDAMAEDERIYLLGIDFTKI